MTASKTTPVYATSAETGVVTGFTSDINAFRASQGIGPLRPNAALARAAQAGSSMLGLAPLSSDPDIFDCAIVPHHNRRKERIPNVFGPVGALGNCGR